jgi:Ala-tRNA(Pro) deacylase
LLERPESEVRLATVDELVGIFDDCEPGVVPPFGRLYDLATVLDVSLLEPGELVFVGNLRHEGLRMRASDYVAIEEPRMGSFADRIAGAVPRPASVSMADRRAG